jgi:diguanylate cyclase (GGDEF)-like protein
MESTATITRESSPVLSLGVGPQTPQREERPHVPSTDQGQTTSPEFSLEKDATKLIEARLGVASGLFTALRCKHAPTAMHSLRVSVGCSAWAVVLKLTDLEREQLEIGGLFHDIGKISVPDSILLKNGPLTPEEDGIMQRHRRAGLEILSPCCPSTTVSNIIRHSADWYDGSRPGQTTKGRSIPLGARMLAIVDAFDSMTSDQVYRRAISRERAIAELFKSSGAQFDPDLVMLFNSLHAEQQFNPQVTQRWLNQIDPQAVQSLWRISHQAPAEQHVAAETPFQQKLLDCMQDGVIFVDASLQIVLWNLSAERLTGISSGAAQQHLWTPRLVRMFGEDDLAMPESECPARAALESSTQTRRRVTIVNSATGPLAVDIHACPVLGAEGSKHGVVIMIHDATSQTSLEEKFHSLHEKATRDPLTQVANRAEFDRTLKSFVAAHLHKNASCALIMTDIDHFKSVNDTYGHQAGDEAIKALAGVMKSYCRPGDLVARYGGEEFAMICASCNNATAAERADEIRRAVSEMAQPWLNGKRMTASFGVTELQAGDTPELMLNRSDRALMEAKQRGRNMVVQLGGGMEEFGAKRRGWFSFLRRKEKDIVVNQWLITLVPMAVTVEKLRGFAADHKAQIEAIEGDTVQLLVDRDLARGATTRRTPFHVEVRLMEERFQHKSPEGANTGTQIRTRICLSVRPKRGRDRRRSEATERGRTIVASIKAYLMATEATGPSTSPLLRASSMLPWQR